MMREKLEQIQSLLTEVIRELPSASQSPATGSKTAPPTAPVGVGPVSQPPAGIKWKTVNGLLSKAIGAFQMIAEDGRPELSVLKEMKECAAAVAELAPGEQELSGLMTWAVGARSAEEARGYIRQAEIAIREHVTTGIKGHSDVKPDTEGVVGGG